MFLTFRYLHWRTTATLRYRGLGNFVFMLTLYAAELYGIVVAMPGLFVSIRPLQRVPRLPIRTSDVLANVGVLILGYIVAITII